MTREEFVSYGVDYDAAMNMFMNNESIYAKFLGKFPKDESYKQLKEAIDNKDCEMLLRRHIHLRVLQVIFHLRIYGRQLLMLQKNSEQVILKVDLSILMS